MADGSGRRAGDERRAEQFRALTEVGRALTHATTCDEVLALAVVKAQQMFRAKAALVMLTDEEELVTVCSRAACNGQPLLRLRERGQDPLNVDLAGRLGCAAEESILAVPLVVGGAVIGLLATVPGRREARSASEEEEWLLSALADQVAVAVEKMRLDEVANFRERLIGIVSHDLRTPITTIHLTAQRLAKLPELSPRGQAMVGRIYRSAERAARMIADLLDFTQIRLSGALTLSPRRVALAAIAAEAVDEIRGGQPEGRIQLRQQGPTEGLFDADRIAQLVGNLLANALAYGDADRPIQVSVEGGVHHTTLIVHNFGRPIQAGSLAQIFEPMHQASGRVRPPGGGLGLGLFICRHIAAAHGGAIEVSSAAIEGTTFQVRFPRPPAEPTQG